MYKNLTRVRRSRSKAKVTRDKKTTTESSPLTMHSRACAVDSTPLATTDDTTACRPGVTGYAGWKISAYSLVFCESSYGGVHLYCNCQSLKSGTKTRLCHKSRVNVKRQPRMHRQRSGHKRRSGCKKERSNSQSKGDSNLT